MSRWQVGDKVELALYEGEPGPTVTATITAVTVHPGGPYPQHRYSAHIEPTDIDWVDT